MRVGDRPKQAEVDGCILLQTIKSRDRGMLDIVRSKQIEPVKRCTEPRAFLGWQEGRLPFEPATR
jgi:hypothetical protein